MSQRRLAELLRMPNPPQAARVIRYWEAGAVRVPGPVSVAVEAMQFGFWPRDIAHPALQRVYNTDISDLI